MLYTRQNIAPGVYFTPSKTCKFKANAIDVRFITPLDPKTAPMNNLVFPVITRATEKYPGTLEFRRALLNLYSAAFGDDVTKRGDLQILKLGSDFLNDKFAIGGDSILDGILDVFDQVLCHPLTENGAFVKKYVDSEKEKLIDAERGRVNNKGRYAHDKCIEHMSDGAPFGISSNGSVDDINAVTPEALYEYYRYLIDSVRVEITAVGDMDFDKVSAFFARVFNGRKSVPDDIHTSAYAADRTEVKTVYEHQSVQQGKLVLAFSTGIVYGDKLAVATNVFNEVYGSGTTSKLFMNVREKLSLCYSCGSSMNMAKGIMTVSAGIMFENEKKAYDEIMLQLEKVKNGEISDFELDSAKKSLIDYIRGIYDGTGAISGFIFGSVMTENQKSVDERIAEIEAVTVADVAEVAKHVKLDTYYFLCGKEDA
ncbi:MAG: insulinase family protein [Clostridia bacterium]|nr:insulinase family protein [Clostridia bacterium]